MKYKKKVSNNYYTKTSNNLFNNIFNENIKNTSSKECANINTLISNDSFTKKLNHNDKLLENNKVIYKK